jgi:hypothetical protein
MSLVSLDGREISIDNQSSWLWLLLATLLPYLCSMLQSFWLGVLRSDRPWPSRSAFLWVSSQNNIDVLPARKVFSRHLMQALCPVVSKGILIVKSFSV